MGYCTTFVISVEDGDPSEGEFDRISHMLETYEDFEFWGDEWVASDVKWYDYNDDMHRLSKEFPQFRFYVHGDGDDSDDLWEDHWQDTEPTILHTQIVKFVFHQSTLGINH